MKFTVLLLVLASCVVRGQELDDNDLKSIENSMSDRAYDSTRNYVNTPYSYIGQTFYLHPYNKWYNNISNIGKGYYHFFRKPITGIVTMPDGSFGSYNIDEYKLNGLYKVTRIIPEGKSDNLKQFIELVNNASKDTVYFQHPMKNTVTYLDFPFIVMGYLSKLKKVETSKEYEIRYDKFNEKKYYDDKNRYVEEIGLHIEQAKFLEHGTIGKEVKVNIGDRYSIIDMIIGNDGQIMRVLRNGLGQEVAFDEPGFYVNFLSIAYTQREKAEQKTRAQKFAQSEKEYVALIKRKFSPTIAASILNQSVTIGMTKDMCRFAWGEPERINTTTTRYGSTEQWVYTDNRYVYFTDGKVSTIQN